MSVQTCPLAQKFITNPESVNLFLPSRDYSACHSRSNHRILTPHGASKLDNNPSGDSGALTSPSAILCHSHNRNVNDSRGRSSHLTPFCAILPNCSVCVGDVLTRSSLAFPLGSSPGSRSPYFYVILGGSYGVAQHWHRIIWKIGWYFGKIVRMLGFCATCGFGNSVNSVIMIALFLSPQNWNLYKASFSSPDLTAEQYRLRSFSGYSQRLLLLYIGFLFRTQVHLDVSQQDTYFFILYYVGQLLILSF
jgi:hypothetical protein